MHRLTTAFTAIATLSVSLASAQQPAGGGASAQQPAGGAASTQQPAGGTTGGTTATPQQSTSGIPGGPAATSGTRGSSGYQASGNARSADTGRLGTRQPNAAAGPIRSSGAGQTGPARGNARTLGQPGAQFGTRQFQQVLPAAPLRPATPLDGPGLAVPVDPGAAPVEGALMAPDAAAPARPRVLPSLGSGTEREDEERLRGAAGNARQVIAPLIGDLENGLRPRAGGTASLAFLARQARVAQRAAAAANAPQRREARRPESPPAAAAWPRVQSYAGRWWHRTSAGDWLVWDASARAWVTFHPGVLSNL